MMTVRWKKESYMMKKMMTSYFSFHQNTAMQKTRRIVMRIITYSTKINRENNLTELVKEKAYNYKTENKHYKAIIWSWKAYRNRTSWPHHYWKKRKWWQLRICLLQHEGAGAFNNCIKVINRELTVKVKNKRLDFSSLLLYNHLRKVIGCVIRLPSVI